MAMCYISFPQSEWSWGPDLLKEVVFVDATHDQKNKLKERSTGLKNASLSEKSADCNPSIPIRQPL